MIVYNASGVRKTGSYIGLNRMSYMDCGYSAFFTAPPLENCTALGNTASVAPSSVYAYPFITPNFKIKLSQVGVSIGTNGVPLVGVPEYWITLGVYQNNSPNIIEKENISNFAPGLLLSQSYEIPVTTGGFISYQPDIVLRENSIYYLAFLASRAMFMRTQTIDGLQSPLGSNLTNMWVGWLNNTVISINANARATGLPLVFPINTSIVTGGSVPLIYFSPTYAGDK